MTGLKITIDGEIGAGKTTLAALLNAHLRDLGMEVRVEGENPYATSVIENAERTKMGTRLGVFKPLSIVLRVNQGTEPVAVLSVPASTEATVNNFRLAEARGYPVPHRETLRLQSAWGGYPAGTLLTDAVEVPETGAPHLNKPVRFFLAMQQVRIPEGTGMHRNDLEMTVLSTREDAEVVNA